MAKNNEAKIKFTAETGDFNDQIKEAEGSMKELRSELKLNSSQMKNTGETTDALKQRQQILAKELDAARSKTEALSSKVEKAKQIFGENSDEVRKLQIQLNNAKSAENAIQGEIDATNKKLKEQKTAFEKVAEKADSAGEKLTNAGKKMSAVSAGIGAVGAASIAAFNEVDEGADNVIRATGATGEAAEKLEESYSKVASSVVGDFGEIGSAVGEVNTRFGFTGSELETASEKFMKFANITGMDSTEAVQSVTRALNDAGIPLSEYDTLLDQLAKAGQTAGIDVGTLSSSLSENGSIMRSMGFNTEETIALLSQFELSGANSSAMLTGMKKAMTNWADEGKNGSKEFAKTVEGIKSGSISASDAIDIFGTKAGPMLVDAIKSGKFEYKDMLATIQNSKGTVESTFDGTVDGGYEMELAMQNAKLALAEVGDTLATSLTPLLQTATEKLKGFANWWGGLSDKTKTTIVTIAGVVAAIGPVLVVMGTVASSISKITTLMNIMKQSTMLATIASKAQAAAQWLLNTSILGCPVMWIIAAIVALVAAFVLLWKKCEGFRKFFINLWAQIKAVWGQARPYFQAIFEGIKTYFSIVKDFLIAGFKVAWEKIKLTWSIAVDYFKMIWNNIKLVFSAVKSVLSGDFRGAWNAIKGIWGNVGSFFSNTVSKIKNSFSKVKDIISKPFQSAVEKVKGLFSKLKLSFPKIKLPHFSITPKGWKVGDLLKGVKPKLGIQWYDKGAILTKPTVFGMNGNSLMVGGEKHPEALVRIDKLQGYIGEELEKHNQNAGLIALAKSIAELADRPIGLNINGRQFAQALAGDTDSVNGLRTRLAERGLSL